MSRQLFSLNVSTAINIFGAKENLSVPFFWRTVISKKNQQKKTTNNTARAKGRNQTSRVSKMSEELKNQVLLDLFRRLPTEFLLCGARLACRKWKTLLESDAAQRQLWQGRANYLEIQAVAVAGQCHAQQVVFESHRQAETQHATLFTPLDRCLHYYSRILLWRTQQRICNSWMAHYYTSSGDMHHYWHAKHARVQRLGAEKFNETNTEDALRTVSTSRSAALDMALQTFVNIPFTAPV